MFQIKEASVFAAVVSPALERKPKPNGVCPPLATPSIAASGLAKTGALKADCLRGFSSLWEIGCSSIYPIHVVSIAFRV